MTEPHKWAPGLPTTRTRVSLWCGTAGAVFTGTVIEDGPEVCVVRWDHGVTQPHPISHLVPESKDAKLRPKQRKDHEP